MDPELKRFEEELGRLSPQALPEGLLARIEVAMEGWQSDGREEEIKVVPFPQGRENAPAGTRSTSVMWAAAAAVAILGCIAGLVFSGAPDPAGPVAASAPPVTRVLQPAVFNPLAAKRRIVESSDRGVVVANGEQPVRLMRLEYVDKVVFRNDQGQEVHVERPAVHYVLIPVSTD